MSNVGITKGRCWDVIVVVAPCCRKGNNLTGSFFVVAATVLVIGVVWPSIGSSSGGMNMLMLADTFLVPD